MGNYYETAQICLNGHIVTDRFKESSELRSNHCDKCGEKTITKCKNCNADIRGDYVTPGFAFIGFNDDIPNFCHECGNPYPWTNKILQNAVELVSLDERLSENHKEIIKKSFPDLLVETPTTPVAVAKYKKYISKSQDFVKDGLRSLLIDIVSEAAKKSIWGEN